jgi:hypothetical protein
MGFNKKPTIEIELTANEMPGYRNAAATPRPNAMAIPMPPQMTSVPAPAPFNTPLTTWGAKRAAKYHRALTDLTNAQSGYLRSRAELAKSFVAATRAANEVAELPEICQSDTEIRRAYRERDYIAARTEVEQARYGLYATQDEVDKLRKPRIKKANNTAAIEALMRTKVDMEALGEDTRGLDETLHILQMQNG